MTKKSSSDADAVKSAKEFEKQTRRSLDEIKKDLDAGGRDGAFARGQLFELIGYFDQAVDAYKDALRLAPECSQSKSRLALAQIKAGSFDDALTNATNVAAQDPNCKVKALTTDEEVSALTVLGDALAVNQRFEDAIQALETARASGGDPYTAGRLAQMYLATGEPEKAVKLRADIADNLRFRDLKSVLALGETNAALLPKFDRATLSAAVARAVVGRPMIVRGEVRTAEAVARDTGWCAEFG